jgi:hypothetical protein
MSAAPGTWLLLSQWYAKESKSVRNQKVRELMDQIALGQYDYRFFWADERERDCLTDELRRTGHKRDRLPGDFWKQGLVNLNFSAVTFPPDNPAARTIVELEIFVPAVATEAVAVDEPAADPYLTGCPGRPTSKYLLLAEAESRLSSGWPGTKLEDFVSELLQWLAKEHPRASQTRPSTAKNALRETFNLHKRNT